MACCDARGPVPADELGESVGVHQRHVGRGDHHGSREVGGQRGERAGDGVSGAPRVVLDGSVDGPTEVLRELGDGRSDAFPVGADHDDQVLRRDLGDRVQRVGQHAAARDRVQHFGQVRPHPSARSRGQHQNGRVGCHRHSHLSIGHHCGHSHRG
jgi:hypothetical protein